MVTSEVHASIMNEVTPHTELQTLKSSDLSKTTSEIIETQLIKNANDDKKQEPSIKISIKTQDQQYQDDKQSIDDSNLLSEANQINQLTSFSSLKTSKPSSTLDSTKRTIDIKLENETESSRSIKKSRKKQGTGVKKPLYTRYESLFIIKAYKTILDHQPNLVLIDLFKIVAILFNQEAKKQGFKERTADQLYQKYKRIQHGLSHGELEFLKFFKQNKYNPKEWIPIFKKVDEDEDDLIKFIKFPRLNEAIKEILRKEQICDESMYSDVKNYSQDSEFEDQLLKLAGYNDNNDDNDDENINNTGNYNDRSRKSINELENKIKYLEEILKFKDDKIIMLKKANDHKEREITFLKDLVKEDLSYIRHKVKSIKE